MTKGEENIVLQQIIFEANKQIQAQQQEIDRLNMKIAELREQNQALKAYAENADADKDEQARKTRQLEEGLKKLRSSLQWLKETIHDLDYKAWAEDNIGKIDALLGGKEVWRVKCPVIRESEGKQ